MTPTEFRSALTALGLSQRGAARAWGVNERTVRHWADLRGEGPPPPVPALIHAILVRGPFATFIPNRKGLMLPKQRI